MKLRGQDAFDRGQNLPYRGAERRSAGPRGSGVHLAQRRGNRLWEAKPLCLGVDARLTYHLKSGPANLQHVQ
eukprot:CAMPEP_0205851830 /NCGR_PEP_ID=MMETSP1083-20121108/702_1 /ASSEMBLY_ACC=CAM_ASM_000430 /TAXON_ID=97485 /ORGANISM="Prymnesium parvum, Strain Texoma1" /LENGTH=71 /DNA_ID=CAMNT_0053213007 /DNA_START=815 /DNA_END=1030 /DNA_ORIENTATION=-